MRALVIYLFLLCSVHAATIQLTIVVDEVDPLYSGVVPNVGTITYTASSLTGVGDETLTDADGISFSLSFDGDTYIPQDDASFPTLPELYFTDGYFVGLNFEAPLKADNATASGYILIDNANVFYSFDGNNEYGAHFVAIALPEPSAFMMLGASLLVPITRRSRK